MRMPGRRSGNAESVGAGYFVSRIGVPCDGEEWVGTPLFSLTMLGQLPIRSTRKPGRPVTDPGYIPDAVDCRGMGDVVVRGPPLIDGATRTQVVMEKRSAAWFTQQ